MHEGVIFVDDFKNIFLCNYKKSADMLDVRNYT